MLRIKGISDAPLQTQTLVLPDGSSFSLEIYYRPIQQGWFINSLQYLTFILRGVRITNSPNMLYQFQNQLPFGLACYSKANREPSLQLDFISNASKLYILTAAEVARYSEILQLG